MAKDLVLVTGFGTGFASAEHAAEGLKKVAGKPVRPFTMSQALTHKRDVFERAVELSGDLYMHSAAAMLAREAHPDKAHFLNPPLPANLAQLAFRTVLKMAYMHIPGLGFHTTEDKNSFMRFDESAIAELATNPLDNLQILRRVMSFHGLAEAESLHLEGVESDVTYTDHDFYFKPTATDKALHTVTGMPLYELPGQHDEVLLNPVQFFENYFTAAEG